MSDSHRDKAEIRDVIESWAVLRDAGDFDRLTACYHADATMHVTWFQGPARQFVDKARASFSRGHFSGHLLGACHIDLAAPRAVAQTRVTIIVRDRIGDALYDIESIGRFYDLFELRERRWAIAERHAVYEKDRADPVYPGETHAFDRAILDGFPDGYRYLAYWQTKRGLAPARKLPGLRGPEIEALYARGRSWLARAVVA